MEKITFTRRSIALWLIAMMVLLSVASSVHSVTHLSKKLSHHPESCVFCIHKHQQHHALATADLLFQPVKLQFIIVLDVCFTNYSRLWISFFNSRAPPF
ncbi:DUF2946 domain-containing protein [Shewanella sp. 10N.286.45.A1]|uniref:DUF2946 domain-containing protein n=1 Tax=Shewanella sp. 10N.286.45.A1 TaxID=3229694 RepID=UPI00354DB6DC